MNNMHDDYLVSCLPSIRGFMIITWLFFVALAYLVYRDAETRGMNGLLWGLPILIPWIGLVFLTLYLILREERRIQREERRRATSPIPKEILDERYAKGDLKREDYLQMKEDLK
jgi:putative membrane protein